MTSMQNLMTVRIILVIKSHLIIMLDLNTKVIPSANGLSLFAGMNTHIDMIIQREIFLT